jgi:hypothetical protein
MDPQDERRADLPPHPSNPFPEPQTIPTGWDLSEILSAPRPGAGLEGTPPPTVQIVDP